MLELLLFLILGLIVGLMGALLGIGGGLVIVPAFLLYFNFTPQQTVGSSTVVVLFNAISGSAAYLVKHLVVVKAALFFGLATIPGAFLGSYVAEYFTGTGFRLCFGVFLLVLGCYMFYKTYAKGSQPLDAQMPEQYNLWLGMACSVVVGFFASALGIGGGIIHVPFMIYVLHFPVHRAIATSTCILAISSLAGVLSHAYLLHILWQPALCVGIGAVAGAQLGVRLAAKSQSQHLLRAVAALVIIMGIKFVSA